MYLHHLKSLKYCYLGNQSVTILRAKLELGILAIILTVLATLSLIFRS